MISIAGGGETDTEGTGKAPMRGKPLIEVRDMCKNFGVTVALNHVSFTVYAGEVVGLIGENGSGKSTVSSIIAGMQPATSGSMVYDGKPWKPDSAIRAQEAGIAMIVQETGTIGSITVAKNIFLAFLLLGTKRAKLLPAREG